MKALHKKLAEIQANLKAPKNLFNNFGKYKYRNAESILEALKPMLGEYTLTFNDDPFEYCNRVFVRIELTFSDGEHQLRAHSNVELGAHKGMSSEQAYGSAISYGKKYLLGHVFLLDDSELDPDAQEQAPEPKSITHKQVDELKRLIEDTGSDLDKFLKAFSADSLEAFPESRYKRAVELLNKKK